MININPEECLGCEICVEECPQSAISITDEGSGYAIAIDLSRCNLCYDCIDVCPIEIFSK